MLEIGVAEAQKSLLKILDTSTIIIDRRSNVRKAVVLPYAEYEKLLRQNRREILFEKDDEIEQFIGLFSKDFKADDIKYNKIIKGDKT